MSIAREQLTAFSEFAVRHFIFDEGTIPGPWKLFGYIDDYIKENDIVLGYPTFDAHKQRKKYKSSIGNYNTNIMDLIFDLNVFYNETINQSSKILEFLSASETQYRGLLKDLDKLTFQYENLLNYDKGTYVLGDNFADCSVVDQRSTTAKIDTSSGKVIIGDGASKRLDFSFMEDVSEPPNIEFISPYISRTKLPGSAFSNILNSLASQWSEYVLTESNSAFSLKFELPLTEDGSEVEINRVYINLVSPKTTVVRLECLRDGGWKRIFDNDIESVNTISFIPVTTSKLRFILTKLHPDGVYGTRSLFSFMIRQIEVYRFDSLNMATIISKPLRITSNTTETVAAGEITLEVNENVPDGTQIEYFIAEDPYVTGAFVLENDYSVVVNPEYGDGSYFEVGYSGDYDEHVWDIIDSNVNVSGTLPNDGEFTWIPIDPISRPDATRTKIFFDYITESDVNAFSDGYVLNIDATCVAATVGDLKLYTIYEWYNPLDITDVSYPIKIKVTAGKNCWMLGEEYYEYVQHFEGTGTLVNGECIITGSEKERVLNNSVVSVRAAGSLKLFTPVDDYIVAYGSPAYGATIHSNAGRMTAEGEESMDLVYIYGVNMLTPRYIYRCYVDLPWSVYESSKQADAEIPLVVVKWWNTLNGKMKKFTVTNFDDEMREIAKQVEYEYAHDVVRSIRLTEIGQGYGKFKLEFELEIPKDILETTEDLPAFIISELNPIERITLPSYLLPYSWAKPLFQVGADTLKYATHKYDHTRFAIYQHRLGYYALMLNNFGQFLGNNVLVFQNSIMDSKIGFIGIDPYDFFDISFSSVNKRCDSFLFRAVLRSDGKTTPELSSYKIVVRNE